MAEFKGYNIFVKNIRDGGHRVEIDVSKDEYDKIKDLPKLAEGIYRVVIKPDVKEV